MLPYRLLTYYVIYLPLQSTILKLVNRILFYPLQVLGRQMLRGFKKIENVLCALRVSRDNSLHTVFIQEVIKCIHSIFVTTFNGTTITY